MPEVAIAVVPSQDSSTFSEELLNGLSKDYKLQPKYYLKLGSKSVHLKKNFVTLSLQSLEGTRF